MTELIIRILDTFDKTATDLDIHSVLHYSPNNPIV